MSWASRAAANFLPLSRERRDLAQALKEWRYAGHYHDLETPSASCQLCDHPDIRYQFEIQNLFTHESLLIGSECINRFGIAATDEEGRTLDAAGTRRKVSQDRRKLVEDARHRRVVSALVALANKDQDFDIRSFVDYLQTRGAFTPKQLSIVLWRLSNFQIAYNPKDFKLTIKRNREKAQLRNLKDWELARVKPCLTASQLDYLDRAKSRPDSSWSWED
jgi:hypothetical protein